MRSLIMGILIIALSVTISCNNNSSSKETSLENQNASESGSQNSEGPKVELTDQKEEQKVDVMIDGKLFTSFCYSDTLMKQILYPIMTEKGNFVTRGWPIEGRRGEQTDHPHHRGMWLNYGDINGYDFWGNSSAIPAEARSTQKGRIKHNKVVKVNSGNGEGSLTTDESWLSPNGSELLSEKTTYHFKADGNIRIIDRITTLAALDSAITFKDTKEGMLGIRYNRNLHLPSDKPEVFTDALGHETVVEPGSKETTGSYISSEGVKDDSVWGTRARWMNLFGNIEGEDVSLVVMDHPLNFDYPTYWHARGYGLFAANPFGARDFTEGKLTIDFVLPKGKSLTFRYRVIVSSGNHLSADQINKYASDFDQLYWEKNH